MSICLLEEEERGCHAEQAAKKQCPFVVVVVVVGCHAEQAAIKTMLALLSSLLRREGLQQLGVDVPGGKQHERVCFIFIARKLFPIPSGDEIALTFTAITTTLVCCCGTKVVLIANCCGKFRAADVKRKQHEHIKHVLCGSKNITNTLVTRRVSRLYIRTVSAWAMPLGGVRWT